MAKKLSRKHRKQQRQKQLNVVAKQNKNLSTKQLQSLSNVELEKQYKNIVSERRIQANIIEQKRANEAKEAAKKKAKYEAAKDLEFRKRESLKALGFDEKFLKTTYLRKIKISDIEEYKKGNEYALGIEKYPFLYEGYGFDFDKVYSFGTKGLYIAWLDYFGEETLENLMLRFNRYSNETLIQFLEGIVRTKPTYDKNAPNKGAGTSSGRAGGVNTGFYSEEAAKIMYDSDNRRIDSFYQNENKKRAHTITNKYYQLATTGDNFTIKEINGRQLLVLLNAIFYNITEDDRHSIYETLYSGIVKRVEPFKRILPEP